jgi:hypothetical protein
LVSRNGKPQRNGRTGQDSGQDPFQPRGTEHADIALADDEKWLRTGKSKLTRLPNMRFSAGSGRQPEGSTKEEISQWQTKAKVTDSPGFLPD